MEVIKNRVYKHFKGDYYIVLDIGYDSDTMEEVVIYRSLYGKGDIFVRKVDDFISKVDCEQGYRFMLQDIKSVREKGE